ARSGPLFCYLRGGTPHITTTGVSSPPETPQPHRRCAALSSWIVVWSTRRAQRIAAGASPQELDLDDVVRGAAPALDDGGVAQEAELLACARHRLPAQVEAAGGDGHSLLAAGEQRLAGGRLDLVCGLVAVRARHH